MKVRWTYKKIWSAFCPILTLLSFNNGADIGNVTRKTDLKLPTISISSGPFSENVI